MAHHDVTRPAPRQHTASDAAHRHLASLLALADVRLDGSRPWDIHLLAHGVPERVLAHGNLGLGESYMDGLWTCERLDQLFDRLLRSDIASRVRSLSTAWHHLRARWLNLQTEHRAWQVGRQLVLLKDHRGGNPTVTRRFRVNPEGIETDGTFLRRGDIHNRCIRNKFAGGVEVVYDVNRGMDTGVTLGLAGRRALAEVAYRVEVEAGGKAYVLASGLDEVTARGVATEVGKVLNLAVPVRAFTHPA